MTFPSWRPRRLHAMFAFVIRSNSGEGMMARISKTDHAAIQRMADVENRRIPDIAAEFGCTPANIYALLSKLRRAPPPPPEPAAPPPPDPAAPPPGIDLFAATPAPKAPPPPPAPPRPTAAAPPPRPSPRPSPKPPAPTPAPAERAGVGAKLAKPGYGLAMRSADGEESLAPFRSIEDLLTAIKPILRSAARSPEPLWFSIQPIDLAAIDIDAA